MPKGKTDKFQKNMPPRKSSVKRKRSTLRKGKGKSIVINQKNPSSTFDLEEDLSYPDQEDSQDRQGRDMDDGSSDGYILPFGNQDFSEIASKKMKKELKSAMKAGTEKSVPYSHSQDLADPWEKKPKQTPDEFNLLMALLDKNIEKGPTKSKRWPSKQLTPTLDMRDFLAEIPTYLKELGILKIFQRIIMNLYVMNPRPKNPCLDVFHLLDKWFGASGKSKVVETLEKEFHFHLLKELRIIQEIGKLKTLCHFLLPEEYGPDGPLPQRVKRRTSDNDILVQYGDEEENDVSKESKKESAKGKKNKKAKEKAKEKKLKKTASVTSFVETTSKSSLKKKKKAK